MRNTELRTSALINWARPGSVTDMAAHRQTQPLSNTGTALLEQMIKKKPGRQSEPQLLLLRLISASRATAPKTEPQLAWAAAPQSDPQATEPQLAIRAAARRAAAHTLIGLVTLGLFTLLAAAGR